MQGREQLPLPFYRRRVGAIVYSLEDGISRQHRVDDAIPQQVPGAALKELASRRRSFVSGGV
jgi:hypothetical protein